MDMREILLYFSMKYEGQFKKIYEALQYKESVDTESFYENKRRIKHKNIVVTDLNYPNFLKTVNCPPFTLFYQGNPKLLNHSAEIRTMIEDGTRCLVNVEPVMKNGRVEFDYVFACENHDNLDDVIQHMMNKGLNFKQYNQLRKSQPER